MSVSGILRWLRQEAGQELLLKHPAFQKIACALTIASVCNLLTVSDAYVIEVSVSAPLRRLDREGAIFPLPQTQV